MGELVQSRSLSYTLYIYIFIVNIFVNMDIILCKIKHCVQKRYCLVFFVKIVCMTWVSIDIYGHVHRVQLHL